MDKVLLMQGHIRQSAVEPSIKVKPALKFLGVLGEFLALAIS